MDFITTIERMNMYTLSAFNIHDLAVSAKKLMDNDKISMNKPPFLSAGANRPNLIQKIMPLCLRVTREMSMVISLVTGPEPPISGKKKLCHTSEYTPTDQIIATQVMLYNFCLLEDYEFSCYSSFLKKNFFNLRFSDEKFSLKDLTDKGIDRLVQGVIEGERKQYGAKGVSKRIGKWPEIGISILTEKNLELYENLSDRRNKLTHEPEPTIVCLEEALHFFHCCRIVAKNIAESFNDNTLNECKIPWDSFESKK